MRDELSGFNQTPVLEIGTAEARFDQLREIEEQLMLQASELGEFTVRQCC